LDDRALTKSDLGDFVLATSRTARPRHSIRCSTKPIEAESARESVSVRSRGARADRCVHLRSGRREARVQYGAATDFEKLLRDATVASSRSYRADAERLVRAQPCGTVSSALTSSARTAVEIRVLVLHDRSAARAAAKSIREGAE